MLGVPKLVVSILRVSMLSACKEKGKLGGGRTGNAVPTYCHSRSVQSAVAGVPVATRERVGKLQVGR